MMGERRAVIDVGTNSVKLLVADVPPPTQDQPRPAPIPLLEKSDQTRLGKGFYPNHQLQPSAIDRTAQAIARFAEEARNLGVVKIRVIGTSAARDARNQSDLVGAIARASGLELEIISGVQEAEWVFAGVTTDSRFREKPLLIVDVGGGSSEFILGQQGTRYFRQSFFIGTVRLLEQCPAGDPPTEAEFKACQAYIDEFLRHEVEPHLSPAMEALNTEPPQLVATGGTASILAGMQLQLKAFDRERIESVCLSREDVCRWEAHLWSLPLAARKETPGLPPNRADVILFGLAIFSGIMRKFGFAALHPTTRGLRFAAVQNEG